MSSVFRWWLFVSVLAAAPNVSAGAPNTNLVGLLDEATETYRAAMGATSRDERLHLFQRSESLFAQLTSGPDGLQSAGLQTNLGNAALQAEHLGTAILAYRRALWIDPDYEQAEQNLEHARSLLPDWVPRNSAWGGRDSFLGWTQRLTQRERWRSAAAIFLGASFCLSAAVRWDRSLLRNMAIILVILWCVLIVSTLWLEWQVPLADAVVIRSEAIVRAADAMNAPARFSEPLPEGTEVRVVEEREGWVQIQLADGRDGWLRLTDLEFVQRSQL